MSDDPVFEQMKDHYEFCGRLKQLEGSPGWKEWKDVLWRHIALQQLNFLDCSVEELPTVRAALSALVKVAQEVEEAAAFMTKFEETQRQAHEANARATREAVMQQTHR